MSIPPEEGLRELLERVHERLSRVERIDPQSRELLSRLTHDIERARGRAGQAGAGADIDQEQLPRLEALAVRFETVHPAFAQALRQLVDLLGKAGI